VVQLGNSSGLAQKAGPVIMRVGVERRKLYRHPPAQVCVLSKVDGSHTSLSEGLKDSVM
jgi:hypothetical protein